MLVCVLASNATYWSGQATSSCSWSAGTFYLGTLYSMEYAVSAETICCMTENFHLLQSSGASCRPTSRAKRQAPRGCDPSCSISSSDLAQDWVLISFKQIAGSHPYSTVTSYGTRITSPGRDCFRLMACSNIYGRGCGRHEVEICAVAA